MQIYTVAAHTTVTPREERRQKEKKKNTGESYLKRPGTKSENQAFTDHRQSQSA